MDTDYSEPIGLPELCERLGIPAREIDLLVASGDLPPSRIIDHRPIWDWTDVQYAWRRFKKPIYKTYIVGFGPYVKIGVTSFSEIKHRLIDIQVSIPEKLIIYGTLCGAREIEKTLHRRFAHYKLRGEWFKKEGELLAWIEAGCAESWL